MEGTFLIKIQGQIRGVRFIIRVLLDNLSMQDSLFNILFTNIALKHPLNSVNTIFKIHHSYLLSYPAIIPQTYQQIFLGVLWSGT